MTINRRGAATQGLKLWLACGFATLAVAAVAWQAMPMFKSRPKPKTQRVSAPTPAEDRVPVVETAYRPAKTQAQRQSVLTDLGTDVQTLAAAIPSNQIPGPADGLADSTKAVLSTMLNVSDQSIRDMFTAMGGSTTDDEGNPRDNSMLVKFIKGMFDEGSLDLSRMVVRPKPDDKPMDNGGPRKVSRDAATREQAAAADGPGENRRVSAIRLVGPYEGMEEIAKTQRPIEVRVPYKPNSGEGERVLALDLLYNPAARTWQMVEMRFEEGAMENGG